MSNLKFTTDIAINTDSDGFIEKYFPRLSEYQKTLSPDLPYLIYFFEIPKKFLVFGDFETAVIVARDLNEATMILLDNACIGNRTEKRYVERVIVDVVGTANYPKSRVLTIAFCEPSD